MPRSINFTSGPECAQNNPYFTVRTIVPERYFYEYLEELILGEFGILPEKGKGYNLSFQDFPQLADLFNVAGIIGDITLTFTEDFVILDVFSTNMVRYANSYCAEYVARVEADGGEVIDPSGVCAALGYLQPAGVVFTRLNYSDSLSVTDNFMINTGRGWNQSLVDVLSLNEIINVNGVSKNRNQAFMDSVGVADLATQTPAYKNKLYLEDNLSLTDLFNVYRQTNTLLSLFDSVTLIDSQDRQVTFTGKYNLSMMDAVLAAEQFTTDTNQTQNINFIEELGVVDLVAVNRSAGRTQFFMDSVGLGETFSSTGIDKTNLTFLDFVATLDQLGLARTATRNLIFNDSIALGDQEAEYVQRYSGSACEIYVDRVESDGGEVIDAIGVCQALTYFNSTPTTGYKLNFTESLSIMTFEAIVSGVRKTYTFAFIDSVDTEDEFTDRRSRNIFLNFTEILDLAASN